MQRSDAHLRPARASPPALRRGGTMSQRRRGERRSSKQAKVHGERPARRGGPGGTACGGMEQLQETSWSVAVSRKISSPANGGTATRSGQGKKPNRGQPGRDRGKTPPGREAKQSRRRGPGGRRIPPPGWWRISRASLARLIPLDSVQ